MPYFTSSKTTLTDYQCVSTGCCTHVAKTEITIDNQHVTKSLQRYRFLPKQPKENTEKTQTCHIFLIWIDYGMQKIQWNGKCSDKHLWNALPILLCLFLYIPFFCWCKGTKISVFPQTTRTKSFFWKTDIILWGLQ